MTKVLYLFGAYRLEPDKGVFRGDREIPLPPKELELLRLLVSLEGRVASHEKIEQTLWPRQVVSYASLARCVYSLRKHLDAEGETYIQTVPKRGYRMVAPLRKEPLEPSSSARAAAVKTTPLAYAHYLEGLREANNPDPDSQERALHWYGEALKVDPEFASAWAAIADVRVFQTLRGYILPLEGMKRARSACEQALALNPFLVAAQVVQAWLVGLLDGAPGEALALVDESLAHDPDYAVGHGYRALLLRISGRFEESLDAIRHAVELDPHSVFNRHGLAWSLFYSGRTEEALDVERQISVAHSQDDVVFTYSAVFAAHLERFDEALDAAYEALRLSRGNPAVQAFTAYAFARAGEAAEARELLTRAGAAKLPRAPRVFLAAGHLALGDPPYALELLEQARAEQCVWLPPARWDPRFAPLAEEPGFLALFQKFQ